MSIRQLTVFVENKQGALVEVTDLLAANGIDMRALSIADTKEFGILRLIVDETEKAADVLQKAGFVAKITPVIGVKHGERASQRARLKARNLHMDELSWLRC